MKNKIVQIIFLLFVIISCKKEMPKTIQETNSDGNFTKYNPEKIKNFSHKNFQKSDAFLIQNLQLIIAEPKEGQKYFAKYLVAFNKQNKIIFEGKGTNDLFQYNPHFFISKDKKQVIICIEMAYEYNIGMDVFLIENNIIKYIGDIDMDIIDNNKSIVDVSNISKKNNEIEFSFKTDSLVLCPGSSDLVVPNKIKYIYKNNKLEFISSDPNIKLPIVETLKSDPNIQSDAENQFDVYISKKLQIEDSEIDIQETYIGDLTGDGLEDVIIFYTTAAEGSNTVSSYRISLFVNENGKMLQYPDFEANYAFTVNGISNNVINITKYDFTDGDEPAKPSLQIPVKIIVSNDKTFYASE